MTTIVLDSEIGIVPVAPLTPQIVPVLPVIGPNPGVSQSQFDALQTALPSTYAANDGSGGVAGDTATSVISWSVRSRPSGIGFPVPVVRPVASNSIIAFDVMPNGTPAQSSTDGFAWFDVCDSDVRATTGGNVATARVGVFTDHVEFGSRAYGTASVKPVYFTVGGTPVIALLANGDVNHEPAAKNSPLTFLVQNDSGGAAAYAQLQVAGGPAAASKLSARAFSSGYTGITGYASGAQLSLNGAGPLFVTTDTGAIRFAPAGFQVADVSVEFKANADVILGKQAALATSATAGFVSIRAMAGTPTGAPAVYTGTVVLVYDYTGDKLWRYNGSNWKSVTFA